MNLPEFEHLIKKSIITEKDLIIDELQELGKSKMSIVLLYRNILMGSVEYVKEKSLDLMIFDVETNSLQYTKTIQFTKDNFFVDEYLSEFFNEFHNYPADASILDR